MDELREKYLQGKLSEEENIAFESKLSDEEREELAFELGVQQGISDSLRKLLREKVAAFEKSSAKTRKTTPIFLRIAASLVLISSLIFYLSRDKKSLFDQYYQPYPNYELTTSRGDDSLTIRQQAYRAYDAYDYARAIQLFSLMNAPSAADYFFRSISYIQIGNYQDALLDLQKVIDQEDKNYILPARWYSALIHLKLENQDEAKLILEELRSGQSEFASLSRQLLDKL